MTAQPVPGVVAVAYSGGRDSTALLHVVLRRLAGTRLRVAALHVHHGLSPHADAWERHCERQCTRWADVGAELALHVHRLQERPAKGQSVEAWARMARYAALRRLAIQAGAGIVLLAHHRRDQAETFLLQALRSAGVAGLASMPRRVEREGLLWCRPWLEQPRSSIEAYVKHFRLRYVDDESNDHPRYERNRLRLQVWPALIKAFPDAETTLADAARWAQDAQALAAEVAREDMEPCLDGQGRLELDAWARLSEARAGNVLRAWFRARSGQPMPATLFKRLRLELDAGGSAVWPAPAGQLQRYRRTLAFQAQFQEDSGAASAVGTPQAVRRVPTSEALTVSAMGRHRLGGWDGTLVVRRAKAGEPGLPVSLLSGLQARPRQGGERFQLGPQRPPRSLKKQYQAVGVPAPLREGPLLWLDDQLVFVPGLGLDARLWDTRHRRAVLSWEPAS